MAKKVNRPANEEDLKPPRRDGRTRRTFLKAGAAGLLGSVLGPFSTMAQQRRPLVIRGGTVLTMDPAIGDFVSADVLIEGSRIVDVKPAIRASADVIDARGMVVIPGLVDAHRHSWQAVFRRAIANADFGAYSDFVNALIPAMRPEDIHVAHLLSDLGALHAGITCLLDYSHVSKTAEIADAAVRGHMDSGIRAVYAYAAPRLAMPSPFPGDVERIKRTFFSTSDQLVTLRLGSALDPAMFAFARKAGIGIHCDGIYGMKTAFRPDSTPMLMEMAKAGILGSDVTLIHATGSGDELLRLLAQHRVNLALAPMSDATVRGLADSVTPVQSVINAGMMERTGLSTDVEPSISGDMFTQMRAALMVQRMFANKRWAEGGQAPATMTVRDILRMATVGGATANGLLNKIGTLTPGKEADIVLIRASDISSGPLNNAAATVVIGGSADLVDTVIVAGQVRKRLGQLLRTGIAKILADAQASRNFLARSTGVWKAEDVLF
jgi:cytosine/adenosine deaminase-related metal-dependent hydrolase